MKTLNTIQKTCKVFKILTKAAMIISFVWAGLTLTGLICGIVWKNGGTIIGVDMDTMLALTQTTALDRMIGELLGDGVFALARLRDWSNGGFVTLGIALILFSLVLRCGAQLIGRTPEEVHID